MLWVGPAVLNLALDRVEHRFLWPFSDKEYLSGFRKAAERLGLGKFNLTPYQCRHGGATRDRLLNLRDEETVRKRGRWSGQEMVRRYSKPGRVQQYLGRFPKAVRDFGKQLATNASDYVLSKQRLLVPSELEEVNREVAARKRPLSSTRAPRAPPMKLPVMRRPAARAGPVQRRPAANRR